MSSISGGIKKKERVPVDKKQVLLDLKLAYAKAINNICNKWIHDSDYRKDEVKTNVRECEDFGTVRMIYQPGKVDKEKYFVEKGHVLFIFKNPRSAKDIKKVTDSVEKMLFEDYKQAKKDCGNTWFSEYTEENFTNIMRLIKPIEFYKPDTWKMTFTPFDDIYGKGKYGWIPKKIQILLGIFDEERYKLFCNFIGN